MKGFYFVIHVGHLDYTEFGAREKSALVDALSEIEPQPTKLYKSGRYTMSVLFEVLAQTQFDATNTQRNVYEQLTVKLSEERYSLTLDDPRPKSG